MMRKLSVAALAISLAGGIALARPLQQTKQTPSKATPKSSSAVHPLQALLDQAQQAMARKDYSAAAEALQKFLAERPDDAVANFHLGFCYTELKRLDEAKAAYRKAIALDPKLAAAYQNLGLILLDQGEFQLAIEPLSKAADLLPDKSQPRLLLGVAMERSGDVARAAEQYRIAARVDAKDADIRVALGRALLTLKNGREAEQAFRAALELRAGMSEARLGLAQALIAQEKPRDAAGELQRYLSANPEDHDTRLQLATLLAETGDNERALAELERVPATDANRLPVLNLRADILQELKRYDEAVVVLRQVLEAEPGNAVLHARAGRLLLEQRDFAAAETHLKRALQLNPQLLAALHDLVSVFYLAERYSEALQAMDLLAKREQPSAGIWFLRASSYDKLGRKPEALAAYQKFVELDQGRSDRLSFQARQRINTLTRELKKK